MNMNKLNNTQKAKRNIVKSLAALCLGLLSIGFTACDDDLDVTQAYPFTSLTITVEDNFGNACEWELEFNNDSDAETEGGIAMSDTLNASR